MSNPVSLSRPELERLVGTSAAAMLLGQGGVMIGRTVRLRSLDGAAVWLRVTTDGVVRVDRTGTPANAE